MKRLKRHYIWIVGLAALLVAPTAKAQPSASPPAGIAWQVEGTTPTDIYAGTSCGVYTFNGEGRWQEVAGLSDFPARRLWRLDGDVLLAGTDGFYPGGLWRYAPGAQWERVLDVLSIPLAVTLDGTTVYGGQLVRSNSVQIIRSTDGGRTWTPTRDESLSGFVSDIEVVRNPATGQDELLIVLTPPRGPGGMWRSADGGRTFQQVPNPPGVTALDGALYVDPTGGRAYTVVGGSDPLRSRLFEIPTDGGTPVELTLHAELGETGVVDLVVEGDYMVVTNSQGMWFSSTRGAPNSWQRSETSFGLGRVFDLHRLPADVGGPVTRTFAATSTGVYGQDARTGAWTPVAPGLPPCVAPGRTVYEPVDPFPDSAERRFFPQTGHSLSLGFKTYWEANGGLPVFGYPLSEEFDERNLDLERAFTTQYFERERFEYHPENAVPYTVLLGRLGAELLAAGGRDWRAEDATTHPFGDAPCQRFEVGGEERSVCGPFLDYWRSNGLDLQLAGVAYEESLALFGLPLTAPREEQNADGDRVLTQWFERARFEYHPRNPAPYTVLLGRLGDEALRLRD